MSKDTDLLSEGSPPRGGGCSPGWIEKSHVFREEVRCAPNTASGGAPPQFRYSHDVPQVCFVFCMNSTQSSSARSPNVSQT
jgi:hypothetical protein